ncbi:MAG TPA: hypothetical protein VMT53_21440 [Terriglobales bacterium]|nr:hypothetical protein [Terriglobales bacterium]
MSSQQQNIAILVALGVLLVAAFPAGAGAFTARCGPLTAVQATSIESIDFIAVAVTCAVLALECVMAVSRAGQPAPVVLARFHGILALRC